MQSIADLRRALVGLCLLGALFQLPAVSAPPNLLLIVTDDQRPDTIHALGQELIRTPALDRLVSEGTTFTRAVTAIPICVASRAEILTGRNGLLNGRRDFGFSVAAGVPHLARTLHDGGYETCYVGKWHTTGRPSQSGYERTEGLYAGGGGKHPLTEPVDWKGMPVTGYVGWVFQTDSGDIDPSQGVGLTRNISEKFADAALHFLDNRDRSRPFFLHVNFTAPHDPLFLPDGYETSYDWKQIPLPVNFLAEHPFDHGNARGRDELLFSFPRTAEQTRRAIAVYYAVIEHLDAQIGRLLAYLDKQDLTRNTLLVFTSDHGLAMGSHGLRGKQNMYDHTVGVPLIVRGPGVSANRQTGTQCYLRDLFPTFCDYAEISSPQGVHGKSLKPVLSGTQNSHRDAVFCSFRDSQFMIRTGEWKYISYPLAGREQLFQLSADPAEQRDLSADPACADIRQELSGRLRDWIADPESDP